MNLRQDKVSEDFKKYEFAQQQKDVIEQFQMGKKKIKYSYEEHRNLIRMQNNTEIFDSFGFFYYSKQKLNNDEIYFEVYKISKQGNIKQYYQKVGADNKYFPDQSSLIKLKEFQVYDQQQQEGFSKEFQPFFLVNKIKDKCIFLCNKNGDILWYYKSKGKIDMKLKLYWIFQKYHKLQGLQVNYNGLASYETISQYEKDKQNNKLKKQDPKDMKIIEPYIWVGGSILNSYDNIIKSNKNDFYLKLTNKGQFLVYDNKFNQVQQYSLLNQQQKQQYGEVLFFQFKNINDDSKFILYNEQGLQLWESEQKIFNIQKHNFLNEFGQIDLGQDMVIMHSKRFYRNQLIIPPAKHMFYQYSYISHLQSQQYIDNFYQNQVISANGRFILQINYDQDTNKPFLEVCELNNKGQQINQKWRSQKQKVGNISKNQVQISSTSYFQNNQDQENQQNIFIAIKGGNVNQDTVHIKKPMVCLLESVNYKGYQKDQVIHWQKELNVNTMEQKDLITLELDNQGNICIYLQINFLEDKRGSKEIVWQSYSGGIVQNSIRFLEYFMENILDPFLYFADSVTDILLLIQFYSNGYYTYFTCLVIALAIERFFQFISCIIFLDKLDKKKYALLVFIYLDFIIDEKQENLRMKTLKKMVRKSLEIIFENLPSTFLNIHSIFYFQNVEEEPVLWTQYVSFFFSLISLSKSILDLKLTYLHESKNYKLYGPKQYKSGNGNLSHTIYAFIAMVWFTVTYAYSFGIFSDVTRPYGIPILIGVVYVYCVASLAISLYYEQQFNKNFLIIMGAVIGIPQTLLIVFGGFLDWTLSKQDEDIKIFQMQSVINSPIRFLLSVLYVVVLVGWGDYEKYPFYILSMLQLLFMIIYCLAFARVLYYNKKEHNEYIRGK